MLLNLPVIDEAEGDSEEQGARSEEQSEDSEEGGKREERGNEEGRDTYKRRMAKLMMAALVSTDVVTPSRGRVANLRLILHPEVERLSIGKSVPTHRGCDQVQVLLLDGTLTVDVDAPSEDVVGSTLRLLGHRREGEGGVGRAVNNPR